MTVLYKKELRRMFGGILPYAAIAILLLSCGIYTTYYNLLFAGTDVTFTFTGSYYALIVTLPMMTCGLYVYERVSGSEALLYSLGYRPAEIVIAKLMAAMTVFGVAAAVLLVHPLILTLFGSVDLAAGYFAWLGYVLMGASLLSVCGFVAAIARRVLVCYLAGVGAVLLLWAAQRFLTSLPTAPWFSLVVLLLCAVGIGVLLWLVVGSRIAAIGWTGVTALLTTVLFIIRPQGFAALVQRVLASVNPFSRYSAFIYGRFDLDGIVYFVSFTAFFVVLTVLLLGRRRNGDA